MAQGGYLHFTDWPNTELADPLGELLDSLELVESLPLQRLFPGHGPVIENPGALFQRLRQRHQELMERVLSALDRPMSAGDLYPRLFAVNNDDYVQLHRVLLGEALGYLARLEARGLVTRVNEEETVRFAPNQ